MRGRVAAPQGLRIVLRGVPAPHLRGDVDELAAHPAPATVRAGHRDQPERDEPLVPVRVALDDDSPLVRGERLARGQHPIQQRIQLLPGDLRVDLPDRTANDPRPIPEERPGGPIRADHHVLVAVEDEHAGRQFGHGPGEGDRVGRGHVRDRLAREFRRSGSARLREAVSSVGIGG